MSFPLVPQHKPRPKLLEKRQRHYATTREWVKVRRVVLARDRHVCRACGSKHGLEVHHVVMRSLGGKDEASNLIALCRDCHASVHGHVLILRWSGRGEPAKTVRMEWIR